MIDKPLPSFEFLVELARDNPEQLDELQRRYTQANINSAPEHLRHRLRGLQFTIDNTLRGIKNPVARCVKLSQLMHQSFSQLHSALTEPVNYMDDKTEASAKILPFRHQNQNDSKR